MSSTARATGLGDRGWRELFRSITPRFGASSRTFEVGGSTPELKGVPGEWRLYAVTEVPA